MTYIVKDSKKCLDEATTAHLVGGDGVLVLQDHDQVLQSGLHQVSPCVLSLDTLKHARTKQ